MIKKIALATAIIGIILYSLHDAQPDSGVYLAQLHKFRNEKNRAFRQSEESPLESTQKTSFDSLKYYPGDPNFEITATVSRIAKPDTTLVPMSDNKTEKYLRWGTAKFTLNNAPRQLLLLLKANGTDTTLFVPFTDLTNGHDSYGGGRYLDVALPNRDETEIRLDFNRAYNPYCAYNNAYSCPVPPAGNRMGVAIPAGEKSFHD